MSKSMNNIPFLKFFTTILLQEKAERMVNIQPPSIYIMYLIFYYTLLHPSNYPVIPSSVPFLCGLFFPNILFILFSAYSLIIGIFALPSFDYILPSYLFHSLSLRFNYLIKRWEDGTQLIVNSLESDLRNCKGHCLEQSF